MGPFSSSKEAFTSVTEAYLHMIATGEIGTLDDAVDVYLVHRFRLDAASQVWESSAGQEQFFLKHPDDKGDHILVNENFDITGVLDWEWASVVSKEEAFSSVCMMWPVAAFYDGANKLADEELLLAEEFREKGRDDMARCVLEGRKVQRMLFAFGPWASQEDKNSFAGLSIGLLQAIDGVEEHSNTVEEDWAAWKAAALIKYQDDPLLKAVLRSVQ